MAAHAQQLTLHNKSACSCVALVSQVTSLGRHRPPGVAGGSSECRKNVLGPEAA